MKNLHGFGEFLDISEHIAVDKHLKLVVYAQLCHYDVIAFVSVLRMCSLVLVSLVYEKWSQ